MLETNWDRICARLDKTAADIIAMRTALEHMASRIVQMEETQALQRLSLNNAFDRLERLEEARDGREEAEKSGAGSVAQ